MAGNPSLDGDHSSLAVPSMRLGLPHVTQGLLSLLAQESWVSVTSHTVISPPGLKVDLTILPTAQGYACHAGG